MKKLLALFTIFFLFLSGCEQNSNSSSDFRENGSSPAGTPEMGTGDGGLSESLIESISLPEYDCSGTYYKLEVVPASYDTDAILKHLIPGFDEGMVQQTDNMEGTDYSIEADGVTHTWYFGEDSFHYHNDLAFGEELTEEEALAKGQDLIAYSGFDVAEHPQIRKETDGSYAIEFFFQHEGIPINRDSINLWNNEEDGMAQGPYIEVWVNGNGITSVLLSHLVDIQGVLEEYQGEEDFVSPSRLTGTISIALQIWEEQLEEKSDSDYRYNLTEIKLVYIPYEEQGRQIFLPAFQVNGITWENETVLWEGELLMIDAVSGRKVR